MKLRSLALVCPLLLSFACSQENKLSGDTKKATPAAADVQASTSSPVSASPSLPEVIPVTTPAPVACDEKAENITSVKLLSTAIDLTQENQLMRYEVSIFSCKTGAVIPFNDLAMGFDMNLIFLSQGTRPLSYKIYNTASTNAIAGGRLTLIKGSDLFGHVTDATQSWFHYETAKVNFSASVEKLILEVNLQNSVAVTFDTGATSALSYLKLGDAQAVEQKVTVTNQFDADTFD